ncbi:mitotic-spindle organizing protein 1 isoform 1-T1 [Liasis olivaceus]
MASSAGSLNAVRETMDVLLEISRLLNTGLDAETLSICVRLCEQGINPEALSAVIRELRKASEALKMPVKGLLLTVRAQDGLEADCHPSPVKLLTLEMDLLLLALETTIIQDRACDVRRGGSLQERSLNIDSSFSILLYRLSLTHPVVLEVLILFCLTGIF